MCRGVRGGKVTTVCGHSFHRDCIGAWFNTCTHNAIRAATAPTLTCPMCRKEADARFVEDKVSWPMSQAVRLLNNRVNIPIKLKYWGGVYNINVPRIDGVTDVVMLEHLRDVIDTYINFQKNCMSYLSNPSDYLNSDTLATARLSVLYSNPTTNRGL